MSENINWINKSLANIHGKDDLGRPNFRVTWSEGQLEKRKCRPRIFIGDRFISQAAYEEVFEVPKYPTIKNRYILERLINHQNPELVENPSYEPIHVFQDKEGNPLPPVWDMVDYACHYIMTGKKRSKASYEEEEAKRMQAEKDTLRAQLHNDRPYLPTMIEMGEAVSLPKTDFWERETTNVGSISRSDNCEPNSIPNQVGKADA